jgi:hypothetical protein
VARIAGALQLTPLSQVMLPGHHFFVSKDDFRYGYCPPPFKKYGSHVTIYPALNEIQTAAIGSGASLEHVPEANSLEFYEFNITNDQNRAHFNFDTQGNVQWRQTRSEAGLDSPQWDIAATLAVEFLRAIGVQTSRIEIFRQLRSRGSSAIHTAEDKIIIQEAAEALEKKIAQNSGAPLKLMPRQLRNQVPSKVVPKKPVQLPPQVPINPFAFDYGTLPFPGPATDSDGMMFEHEGDRDSLNYY